MRTTAVSTELRMKGTKFDITQWPIASIRTHLTKGRGIRAFLQGQLEMWRRDLQSDDAELRKSAVKHDEHLSYVLEAIEKSIAALQDEVKRRDKLVREMDGAMAVGVAGK